MTEEQLHGFTDAQISFLETFISRMSGLMFTFEALSMLSELIIDKPMEELQTIFTSMDEEQLREWKENNAPQVSVFVQAFAREVKKVLDADAAEAGMADSSETIH